MRKISTLKNKIIQTIMFVFILNGAFAQTSYYFRSKQNGSWTDASSWESSPNNSTWSNAAKYPTYTASAITVLSGDTITFTSTGGQDTVDQVVVNGMLIFNHFATPPQINNGIGVDLAINGTFEDIGHGDITWASSATYSLGSSGTMIRTYNTDDSWRDNYEGGISEIPATANWIQRKLNSGSTPNLITAGSMYYPNLIVENNYSGTWTTASECSFTGSEYIIVKGNLDIGGSGSHNVSFLNENDNELPIFIGGDVTVRSGSTLRSQATGLEIQGDIIVPGTWTNTDRPMILLSGSANQIIDGSSLEFVDMQLNKNTTNSVVTLADNLSITHNLSFAIGYLFTTSTDLLIIKNNAGVSDMSDSSFVSGPVKKIGDDAFEFPIGKGQNFQSILITAPTSTTDAFTAEYFNTNQSYGTDHDSSFDYISLCEYHVLSRNTGTSTVVPTISLDMHSCIAALYPSPRVGLWNGSKWTDKGIGEFNGDIYGGTINSGAALTSYGPIALVNNSADKFAPVDTQTVLSSMLFIKNNGQIVSTTDTTRPDIKYYFESKYPSSYFTNDSLFYVFSHTDTTAGSNDTLVRIGVSFVNGLSSYPIPQNQSESRNNYFLANCPDGVTNVPSFQRLVYCSIYDKIDLVYSTNTAGMKYSFHVKPRGLASSIHQKYDGADSVRVLGDGRLCVYTSLEELILEAPTALSINDTFGITTVNCNWSVDTNGYSSFEFPDDYNTSLPLLIQISKGSSARIEQSTDNLKWSTYYGGGGFQTLNEGFFKSAVNNSGELHLAGVSNSTKFPLTNGALYTANRGSSDAVVVKFKANGIRDFATYYGGTKGERATAITIDDAGSVYIAGNTLSSDLPPMGTTYSTSDSSFIQASKAGGSTKSDIFIAKFSANGNIIEWSTYYGGTNDEIISDMAYDYKYDYIYMVGGGDAGTPHKIKSGAYNQSAGEGLILKFNEKGKRYWATNLGGSGGGQNVNGVDVYNGEVYVTGTSSICTFPTLNAGVDTAFNNGLGGWPSDGFVTKFNSSNAIAWSTLYGGTNSESATEIEIDTIGGKVFIVGYTYSSNLDLKNPGSPAYIDSSYNGGDGFIAEFNCTSGALNWSTYYGAADVDKFTDITIDAHRNIFISGYTFADALPQTYNYISGLFQQSSKLGNNDGLILGFASNRNPFWATLFGGTSADPSNEGGTDNCWTICAKGDNLFTAGATNSEQYFPLNNEGGVPYYQDSIPGVLITGHSATSSYPNVGFISKFDISMMVNTGIKEIPKSIPTDNFSIYPNPTNNQFEIQLKNSSQQPIQISIFDISGRLVYNLQDKAEKGTYTKVLNASTLLNGIYVVNIKTAEKIYTKKLIKQ